LYIHRTMITDYPTATIYLVFAMTYCKVKVYVEEEAFIRKLLSMSDKVELLDKKESKERKDDQYDEIDTRILSHLIKGSLSSILSRVDEVAQAAKEIQTALDQARQE
jgi:hypothetical protein